MSKHNNIKIQRNAIVFVDDSDICSGGVECEIKIQEIVDYYVTMCEATVGSMQKEMVMMSSLASTEENEIGVRIISCVIVMHLPNLTCYIIYVRRLHAQMTKQMHPFLQDKWLQYHQILKSCNLNIMHLDVREVILRNVLSTHQDLKICNHLLQRLARVIIIDVIIIRSCT